MKKILALFTANPTQNTVFQTSDGYNFFEEHFADAHASSLKNKKVTPITRAEALESVEVEAEEVKSQEPAPEPAPEPAKEPVQEPVQEPVKEPAQEPAPEPAKEPVQEPVKEPTQEPTPEPAPAAKKKKTTTKTENQ